MIVYRDGGSAMETGKLSNISLHVLHTRLVSFYVNYSLHIFMLTTLCILPCYFVHNYLVVRLLAITTSTHLSLLLCTVNINLCGIVYSVLHGVLLIINVVQHIWTYLVLSRPFFLR